MGRNLGIAALTGAQLLIGAIHVFSGALLLAYEDFSLLQPTIAYAIYTLVFGLLVLVFAVSLAGQKGRVDRNGGGFAVRYCCRCFGSFGFAKYPGDPKGGGFFRTYLQCFGCGLLVAWTR